MAVVYCFKELKHVFCSCLLCEFLSFLPSYRFVKICAIYVVHDQVNVLFVIISFEVWDDIWMIKLVHDIDFLLDLVNTNYLVKLEFVHHFYRH